MSAYPPIVVIFLTYARTDYALRTLRAATDLLAYPNLLWYVADDGSSREHIEAVRATLAAATGKVVGEHSERLGYGASANRAWHVAHDHADITLWLEDDWVLSRIFNPSYYAQTLLRHDFIGMIRLAHLPVSLRCETMGFYSGGHGAVYLKMDRSTPYAFSGNPALRHRRAREAWGAYPEGLAPGDTEVAYDGQIRERGGPCILWPVDIGENGLFGHIGEIKSY
jgi:hypothetical protein